MGRTLLKTPMDAYAYLSRSRILSNPAFAQASSAFEL
ncbi:hypothetical protein [Azospirillum endophyticum]